MKIPISFVKKFLYFTKEMVPELEKSIKCILRALFPNATVRKETKNQNTMMTVRGIADPDERRYFVKILPLELEGVVVEMRGADVVITQQASIRQQNRRQATRLAGIAKDQLNETRPALRLTSLHWKDPLRKRFDAMDDRDLQKNMKILCRQIAPKLSCDKVLEITKYPHRGHRTDHRFFVDVNIHLYRALEKKRAVPHDLVQITTKKRRAYLHRQKPVKDGFCPADKMIDLGGTGVDRAILAFLRPDQRKTFHDAVSRHKPPVLSHSVDPIIRAILRKPIATKGRIIHPFSDSVKPLG